MPRISRKASTALSLVLAGAFMVALFAAAFIFPIYVDALYIQARMMMRLSRDLLLVIGYLALAVSAVADGLLIALLWRVRRSLVFTDESVAIIRRVSWCCFFIGLLLCVLGFYYVLCWVLCFAAVLLGLCLRVVKNVIEEATEIKNENDLTV